MPLFRQPGVPLRKLNRSVSCCVPVWKRNLCNVLSVLLFLAHAFLFAPLLTRNGVELVWLDTSSSNVQFWTAEADWEFPRIHALSRKIWMYIIHTLRKIGSFRVDIDPAVASGKISLTCLTRYVDDLLSVTPASLNLGWTESRTLHDTSYDGKWASSVPF